MSEKQFNPDQPRDEDGKWSNEGASAESDDKKPKQKPLSVHTTDALEHLYDVASESAAGEDDADDFAKTAADIRAAIDSGSLRGHSRAAYELDLYADNADAAERRAINIDLAMSGHLDQTDPSAEYPMGGKPKTITVDGVKYDLGVKRPKSSESKKKLGTLVDSSTTIPSSDLTTEKGQGMADQTLALEAAKQGDFSRRALLEQTWDVFLPLHGASSNPDEVGLCINVKSVGEHFKVDGSTMSVSAVLSDESGPDRAKEILVLDGGDLEGWKRNPLGLFQHNKMLPVSLYQHPDSKEFTVRRVNKQLVGTEYFVQKGPMAELANQVFQLHECGLLRGKSLGFLSAFRDYERIPDDPQNAYGPATTRIKAWKAFECSSVFIPENDRSLVTQVVRKGLGQGVGLKALAAPLAAMLIQYAEPETIWSPGGTVGNPVEQTKTMPGGTTMSADAGDQIKCTKCGCGYKAYQNNADNCCPSCTALKVGELKKELETFTKPGESGKSLKERAESATVMEKAIGRGIGFHLEDYAGRPHQKALRAIFDASMFTATSAIVTMQNHDGMAEKSLRDLAAEQIDKAQKCLNEYASTYPGEDMSWATMNPGDVADAYFRGDASDVTKELVSRCAEWALRTKGWGRGHTFRIQEGAKMLRNLLTKPTNETLTADERTKIEAHLKSFDEMIRDNGTLVSVNDRETDEKIKKLGERLDKSEKETETVRKALNNAKYGRGF